MAKRQRFLTTIDLPNAAADICADLLQGAGFVVGTVGGGEVQFEREGKITKAQQDKLRYALGRALFEFDVTDLDEATAQADADDAAYLAGHGGSQL